MKSTLSLLPVVIGLAAAACDDAADSGFATLNGGTTGGAAGETVTVTTQDELSEYAGAEEPYVIKLSGRINIDPLGTEIEVASDKTIVGVGTDGEIYGGGFFLDGSENVILRNLIIGMLCYSLQFTVVLLPVGIYTYIYACADGVGLFVEGNTYDPSDPDGKGEDYDAIQMVCTVLVFSLLWDVV